METGSRGLPTPPQGTVIALDLVPFESVPHATCLSQMNILSDECTLRLTTLLMEHSVRAGVGPSGCIDVILSDMAPSTTGHKDMDHDKIIKLCYAALKFSVSHLTTGGTFLCKLWHGRRERDLHQDLENLFEEVRYVKPPASRDDSSEVYLLAKKFRGIKRTHEPPVGGAKAPIDAAEAEENR